MKIVHVGEYVSGGVATYLRTLVNQQINNSQISQIIIFKSKINSEQLFFRSEKVQVIEYDYKRSAVGIIKLLRLWRKIVALHPDVVHLHSTFSGILRLNNLPRNRHFKVIYCAHGWAFARDSAKFTNWAIVKVERILAHGADRIVNISNSEQQLAESVGLPRNKMITVNNAITIPSVLPRKSKMNGPLKVLFVGRFDRQKGVDILIEAAKNLPAIEFELAGKPVVDGVKIDRGNLPDNVTTLGWLSEQEVSRKMLESDAVIIPSRWEGFGLVALEAMLNQCAVLASNVGGLADIVQDGVNGLLFAPNDKNSIVKLVQETSRSALLRLGINGQKFVITHYNAEVMENKLFSVYQKH